ncbi:CoA transferase [Nonomuraea sp. NPDC026600]|uniref:CaiB/BaiF CoA transferase family protein n=1 Tax=Nonomuraea sp. NPDC026600 TaxID=3155363 RepID=UPI003406196E
MHQPLTGVRVIDLTRALAGPMCTALLADMGAEVLKVEALPRGDGARMFPPYDGSRSLYFTSLNRGKKSVALDLRSGAGMSLLRRLIAGADVLVENFRPGVLADMGLAPERLRVEHPRLVIAGISGYGPVGPERATPGLDQIAQGMSGLMSLTGAGEHTPMRVGVPIIDTVSGIVAAYGIAAALAGRNATGQGSHIQTSLLESAISILTFQAQDYLSTGHVPRPQGNDHPVLAPYGTFATADHPINIALGSLSQWTTLCEVLGEPELAGHPDYADPLTRLGNRDRLRADLERLLAAHPSAHWIPRVRAAGIPCGPIHALDQVFTDPQVQALDMVHHLNGLPLLRGPLWADDRPVPVHSAPPELGADTVDTLTALGLSQEELDDLIERAVIGVPSTEAAREEGAA